MSYIDSAIGNTANVANNGGGWGSMSTGQKWGLGGAAAGIALPMLFGGGGGGLDQSLAQLNQSAAASTDLSKSLNTNAQDLFKSVLPYLRDIMSGNQQSVLQATMPERRKVMDQYDAARKSIAEFSPRSGGTASAMNEMRGNEASDLAGIAGQARQNAFGQGATLGSNMQSLGLNAQGQAAGTYANIASIEQAEAARKAQEMAGFGQAAGSLLALAFR